MPITLRATRQRLDTRSTTACPAKPWARCRPRCGRRSAAGTCGRYITEAEAELRVQALLDRAEATLRPGGAPVTIQTSWVALADRAGRSNDADLRAAAALADMAMGLRPS